jgi:hypothetical protein
MHCDAIISCLHHRNESLQLQQSDIILKKARAGLSPDLEMDWKYRIYTT